MPIAMTATRENDGNKVQTQQSDEENEEEKTTQTSETRRQYENWMDTQLCNWYNRMCPNEEKKPATTINSNLSKNDFYTRTPIHTNTPTIQTQVPPVIVPISTRRDQKSVSKIRYITHTIFYTSTEPINFKISAHEICAAFNKSRIFDWLSVHDLFRLTSDCMCECVERMELTGGQMITNESWSRGCKTC